MDFYLIATWTQLASRSLPLSNIVKRTRVTKVTWKDWNEQADLVELDYPAFVKLTEHGKKAIIGNFGQSILYDDSTEAYSRLNWNAKRFVTFIHAYKSVTVFFYHTDQLPDVFVDQKLVKPFKTIKSLCQSSSDGKIALFGTFAQGIDNLLYYIQNEKRKLVLVDLGILIQAIQADTNDFKPLTIAEGICLMP